MALSIVAGADNKPKKQMAINNNRRTFLPTDRGIAVKFYSRCNAQTDDVKTPANGTALRK
jgi:hypothetical protein